MNKSSTSTKKSNKKQPKPVAPVRMPRINRTPTNKAARIAREQRRQAAKTARLFAKNDGVPLNVKHGGAAITPQYNLTYFVKRSAANKERAERMHRLNTIRDLKNAAATEYNLGTRAHYIDKKGD